MRVAKKEEVELMRMGETEREREREWNRERERERERIKEDNLTLRSKQRLPVRVRQDRGGP